MTSRMQKFPLFGLAAAALISVASVVSAAQTADPFTGSWTLDVAKSKYSPGPAPKTGAVTFAITPKGVHAAITGVSGTGEAVKWEYTAQEDGKDYPVTGNPDADTIVLKRISKNSVETTYKKAGKATLVNVRTVSADGKVLTVTTKGTNAQGQTVNNVQVFTKKA